MEFLIIAFISIIISFVIFVAGTFYGYKNGFIQGKRANRAEFLKHVNTIESEIENVQNEVAIQIKHIDNFWQSKYEHCKNAYYVNMLRAFPDKSHEAIKFEIDKSLEQ